MVIGLFGDGKKTLSVESLKIALTKKTGSGKAIHLHLSKLATLGLVDLYEEKGVKVAELTKAGKEEIKNVPKNYVPPVKVERKKRVKKETTPVVEYVPLYTQEQLDEMKKKKRAKALKKMEKHEKAWREENPTPVVKERKPRVKSEYTDSVPVGKWQKSVGKPTPSMAARDLWDDIVTPNILITKRQFVEECQTNAINKGTATAQWYFMVDSKNTAEINVERLKLASGVRGRGVQPELPPFVVEPAKTTNVEEKPKKEKKTKKVK
jgi:hypothetical protein